MTIIATAATDRKSRGRAQSTTKGSSGSLWSILGLRVLALALILGLWILTVKFELVSPVLSKSPIQVWDIFIDAVKEGKVVDATLSTVGATLAGFVLASVVGIVIGTVLALMPRLSTALDPFLDALNAMPRVALAPVFIIYFGIGTSAKIALAFSIVVFVLIFSTRAGIRSADPEIMKVSAMMGATRPQLFWKVLLPVSVPSIFAGLRLGLVYSFLGVVTSEIIASRQGLGTVIMQYSGSFQMEGVYAFLILLALIASFFNVLMASLEKHILRWQPPKSY